MTDYPQEIAPRGPRYGNFRSSLAERSKKKQPAAWKRAGMSADHLEFIRAMPCCVCLKINADGKNDPHHLKSLQAAKERGVGLKATDKWCVPLCRFHHDDLERYGSRREPGWFWGNGVSDVHELAHCLWNATGDLGRMIKVMMAHRK